MVSGRFLYSYREADDDDGPPEEYSGKIISASSVGSICSAKSDAADTDVFGLAGTARGGGEGQGRGWWYPGNEFAAGLVL